MTESYPFPNASATPLSLPPATVTQIGATPTYPLLLDGGANIALQFSADSTVGVVLDFLRHKPGTDFDFLTSLVDTAALEELDGRLWEIRYTHRGNTTSESGRLSPKDATSFESYDVTTAYSPAVAALLMVWNGVVVPGAAEQDRIKVVGLVTIGADDDLSHWSCWIVRERGNSVSIDEIEFPILWIKGPSTEEGGESHHEGQQRTRLLVPTNTLGFAGNPTTAPNSDLYTWAENGYQVALGHPAVSHPMQFGILMSAHDSGPDNAFLRMLYLATEDPDGYPKRFNYRGYHHTNGADDGYLRWSVGHLPSYTNGVWDRSSTDWSNSYEMTYTVAIGALNASADGHFWYDAAQKYKERVTAIGALPPRIEANPALISGLNRGPAMWVGVISLNSFEEIGESDRFAGFRHYIDMLRAATRGEHVQHDKVWVQVQSWSHKSGTVHNPPFDPRDPEWGPADPLADFLREAFADGICCYGYSRPGDINLEFGWPLPEGVARRGRSGEVLLSGNKVRLDDSTARNQWWIDNITAAIKGYGFKGQYHDGFGGGPDQISYPAGGILHPRGGGRWGNDARDALIEAVRAAFAFDDIAIGIEAVQEWISAKINIQQVAVLYLPGHMQLAEEAVRLSVTNVPEACRHMNPPIWEAVYGGRIPAQQLALHMGNWALETNTDWNPRGGAAGLTAAEFIDYYCFTYATCFAHGNLPLLMQCQLDLDGHDPVVTGSPSGVSNSIVLHDEQMGTRTDPTKDPSNAGATVMAFLRTLHQTQLRTFAGDMILFGDLLRPLSPDYTSADNSRATNPVAAMDPANINLEDGRHWGILYAPLAVALSNSPPVFLNSIDNGFEVPDALFQMWRSPEGVVGLVVVNWTRSNATFNASFDPADYGITPPYDIIQRNLGAAPTTLASGVGAGAHVIGNSGVVDTTLPTFTPHSVFVFTFEP